MSLEEVKTLTYLAQCIANKKGKNYSIQNLSTKLKRGTVNSTELSIILEELPTLLIYKDGKAVERIAGFMPKSTIISNIEKHL